MHKRTFFLTQRKLNSTRNPLELVIFLRDTPMTFRFFLNFQLFILTKISSSSPLYIDYFSGIHLDRRFLRRKERAGPSQGSH